MYGDGLSTQAILSSQELEMNAMVPFISMMDTGAAHLLHCSSTPDLASNFCSLTQCTCDIGNSLSLNRDTNGFICNFVWSVSQFSRVPLIDSDTSITIVAVHLDGGIIF